MQRNTDDETALIETFRAAGGERIIRFRRGQPRLPKAETAALSRLVRRGRIRRHATLGRGCVSYRLREFAGVASDVPHPHPPIRHEPTNPLTERLMTEGEWLTATDPGVMLRSHVRVASDRKLRLFQVACCERVEHLLVDDRSRTALAGLRRFVDDPVHGEEWEAEADNASDAYYSTLRRAGVARYGPEFEQMTRRLSSGPGWESEILNSDSAAAAAAAVLYAIESPFTLAGSIPKLCAIGVAGVGGDSEANSRERHVQARLLRDIFGNPFRPVTADPSWHTETVVMLATSIYTERAFDRMPILADALEDAGCDHPDSLTHCRGDGVHVRGCWVIDSILGKE